MGDLITAIIMTYVCFSLAFSLAVFWDFPYREFIDGINYKESKVGEWATLIFMVLTLGPLFYFLDQDTEW